MSRRLLPCLAVFLGTSFAAADNWPRWRGPNHDGVSLEKTAFPTKWDDNTNIAWKFKLPGLGSSTPAVWGDHIFVTAEDGKDSVLLCIGTDGKEKWRRPIGKARGTTRGDEGDGACASPSTDGKHVWVFVLSGEVACFDFDGKEVWKFNAQERYGKFNIAFGMHSTPVLDGDRLYLQLIHTGGAWIVAVDAATGKDVWKVQRPSDGRGECLHSYASATLWRSGKDACLVVHGNDYATGHALDDGRELWRVGDLNPKGKYNATLRFVASPVATPDLIVIPSAKNGPVVGLKPGARGKVETGSEWEQWRRMSGTPDVPSPLVHNGLVYLCRENGFVICMDAKTGKEHYNQRIHSSVYRGSPVFAGGHIYLTARDGTITVIKPGPAFELVAENKLKDLFAASPAMSGGRIYLHGREALFAIGANAK